jgi:sulfonate transport system ATP-binding protein
MTSAKPWRIADRVILIEDGRIGLDLTVDLPRPRRKGSVKLAELEAEVLDRVLSPPSPLSQATRRAAN